MSRKLHTGRCFFLLSCKTYDIFVGKGYIPSRLVASHSHTSDFLFVIDVVGIGRPLWVKGLPAPFLIYLMKLATKGEVSPLRKK